MSDGLILDEYRLVRRLGRGGMGQVWVGHDTLLDRPVAIKLIGARNPDATARDRFVVEARAVARLQHPNVVTIFRVGTTVDGRPYLAQELIRGASLDRMALPVTPARVRELALGIARGLAAAHRRGILHRDVKPANVMLADDGSLKLLDFGLAKLVGEVVDVAIDVAVVEPAVERFDRSVEPDDTRDLGPVDPAAITQGDAPVRPEPPERELGRVEGRIPIIATAAGIVLGTPRYLAPELWRGEPATVRTDLYALGILLHELAAGSPPFPQHDLAELRAAVLAAPTPPLAPRAPGVDARLIALIERLHARDADARPETADQIVHELETMLGDAIAPPAGNPYRGLHAFEAEHRALFFGRGKDVTTLCERLRAGSLVCVAGDSGIGKSSVCRAGVAPAIAAGALGDGRRWRVVTMMPGRSPATRIAEALDLPPPAAGLDAAARVARIGAGNDQGVLLIVDQLEELITLADPSEAAGAAELLAAIAAGVPGVKALTTVRGDFLTRVAALPALGAALARDLHLLRVLGHDELRDAVIGPARAVGVRFEHDDMVGELVAGAEAGAGLPLLQFALAELWQARDEVAHVIPQTALTGLGGVAGALARHAERVMATLDPATRASCRRVLLRLVTAERTRAVRSRGELAPPGDGPAAAALEALVHGRLLVARDHAGGAPTYELAHEALIAYVETTRRAARGRRVRASALGLVIAASIIAAIAGPRIAAARARDRAVAVHVSGAELAAAAARDADASGREAAARAMAGFDRDDTAAAERAWAEARRLDRSARDRYREAARELEAAVLLDGGGHALRRRLAAVLLDHALVAERDHDRDGTADLVARLDAIDGDLVRARWRQRASLDLTVPSAARLVIDRAAGEATSTPIAREDGPRLALDLEPGSYLVTIVTRDGLDIAYPLLLGRGEHLVRTLELPARARIPAGFAYVPAGRFLLGSGHDDSFRRDFLYAPPLHAAETGAFLIARRETTLGEWMEFLSALPPAERDRRRPRTTGSDGLILRVDDVDGGGFLISMQIGRDVYEAGHDGTFTYARRDRRKTVAVARLPVVGIDWDDVGAYTAWLDATGRVPGARPCRDREWERAARGADDRNYPHGDALGDDDANHDSTYGRAPGAMGPDEVGSHPRSRSLFGVDDLTGNVWEWVATSAGPPATRGGSWSHGATTALIVNRDPSNPSLRNLDTGLRVCADAPAAR